MPSTVGHPDFLLKCIFSILFALLSTFVRPLLKTYAAYLNAHHSCVRKYVKLAGSCLSTIIGFGSTQLLETLMSNRCSDIVLTKQSIQSVSETSNVLLSRLIVSVPKTDKCSSSEIKRYAQLSRLQIRK